MVNVECDRCGERKAHVGMWDDNVLCGRIDAICEDCYEDGHRTQRPIKPPYNEDGELYYHLKQVDCPNCDGEHIVKITDTIGTCPRMMAEDGDHEEIVFDVTELVYDDDE